MGVGMPQWIYLAKFGVIVADYFGHVPYHVGSSLDPDSKTWRDVDVRLIMDDDEFDQRYGRVRNCANAKLAAITMAFSALGKEMTGLPVDFQIQPQSWANEHYGGQPRGALDTTSRAWRRRGRSRLRGPKPMPPMLSPHSPGLSVGGIFRASTRGSLPSVRCRAPGSAGVAPSAGR